MSITYSAGTPYYPAYIQPSSIPPNTSPARSAYEKAGSEFKRCGQSLLGDQYGQRTNRGLEALTSALQQDMAQLKQQVAQNQAALSLIKLQLNIIG